MDGRVEQLTAELLASLRRTAEPKVELDMAAGLDPRGTVPHDNVIEDVAADVSRLTQQLHLRNLNADHHRAAACPGCGGRCEVQSERRPVTTLAGTVELDELVAHGPVCPVSRDRGPNLVPPSRSAAGPCFPAASGIGVRRPRAHAAGRAADHGRRR